MYGVKQFIHDTISVVVAAGGDVSPISAGKLGRLGFIAEPWEWATSLRSAGAVRGQGLVGRMRRMACSGVVFVLAQRAVTRRASHGPHGSMSSLACTLARTPLPACVRARMRCGRCASDVDRSILDAKMADLNLDPPKWQSNESTRTRPKVARAMTN